MAVVDDDASDGLTTMAEHISAGAAVLEAARSCAEPRDEGTPPPPRRSQTLPGGEHWQLPLEVAPLRTRQRTAPPASLQQLLEATHSTPTEGPLVRWGSRRPPPPLKIATPTQPPSRPRMELENIVAMLDRAAAAAAGHPAVLAELDPARQALRRLCAGTPSEERAVLLDSQTQPPPHMLATPALAHDDVGFAGSQARVQALQQRSASAGRRRPSVSSWGLAGARPPVHSDGTDCGSNAAGGQRHVHRPRSRADSVLSSETIPSPVGGAAEGPLLRQLSEGSFLSGVVVAANPVIETRQYMRATDLGTGNKTINQYEVLWELGRGAYSKVKLCRHQETKALRALKIMKKSLLRNLGRMAGRRTAGGGGLGTALAKVQREVAVMKKLRHRNLVSLHEVIDDPDGDKIILVLEYVQGGPVGVINTELGTVRVLSDAWLRRVLYGTARGLRYLHHSGVIHRDIKPENILVDERAGAVRIGDLGACYVCPAEGDMINAIEGTPAFFAPESLPRPGGPPPQFSGRMADVWALGVTVFALAVGRLPFHAVTRHALQKAILEAPLSPPGTVDPALAEIICGLLKRDPGQRTTLRELRRHPYVMAAVEHRKRTDAEGTDGGESVSMTMQSLGPPETPVAAAAAPPAVVVDWSSVCTPGDRPCSPAGFTEQLGSDASQSDSTEAEAEEWNRPALTPNDLDEAIRVLEPSPTTALPESAAAGRSFASSVHTGRRWSSPHLSADAQALEDSTNFPHCATQPASWEPRVSTLPDAASEGHRSMRGRAELRSSGSSASPGSRRKLIRRVGFPKRAQTMRALHTADSPGSPVTLCATTSSLSECDFSAGRRLTVPIAGACGQPTSQDAAWGSSRSSSGYSTTDESDRQRKVHRPAAASVRRHPRRKSPAGQQQE
eukprot:TRINITY_DN7546_c0_g1_i1.p1 TRINITY_DN7546_c0_g1~~TRINITY_DN7546_c0_g1_i1.p1  ORF type:complete len:900 (+),score=196.22 TRINITY_DN7546_c0_g1_i1:70-2769(+)